MSEVENANATNNNENKGLKISLRSFIISMAIILALMIVCYVLTLVLPAGSYQRVKDASGNLIIYTDEANPYGIYKEVTRNFPFWKFLLSPFLCLGAEGGITIIAIIIFLLVIGGIFEALSTQNVIKYLLDRLINKFYKRRYLLLVILPLCFMLLSSFSGTFEEVVPLIPIITALVISLGWNNLTGISISLVAAGCGFAAGILNPFGTGIAQRVAGVAAFSGVWMRIVAFVVLFLILEAFLFISVRRYEKKHPVNLDNINPEFEKNEKFDKAILALGIIIGVGILIIILSTFIKVLQDYTLYIFALAFLIAGVSSCLISGMKLKDFFRAALKGIVNMLPAALMVLFASSIKYTLTESNTIDTVLKYMLSSASSLPKWSVVLFVYLIVLILEFFVPSGSAKAFLVIPLTVPIANVLGIPVNLIILAYIFGDGLANFIYPTNPALLISLNLANTNYGAYFKHIWAFVLALLAATVGLLVFAFFVGYC